MLIYYRYESVVKQEIQNQPSGSHKLFIITYSTTCFYIYSKHTTKDGT